MEWGFVAELLLLADTLEVLWNLSSFLQARSASLVDVKHKLSVAVATLSGMKKTAGLSLSKLLSDDETATSEDQYDGVSLSKTESGVQVNNDFLFHLFVCSQYLDCTHALALAT